MKIKKQYDLLKKIKHSKEGISAHELSLQSLREPLVLMWHIWVLLRGFILSQPITKILIYILTVESIGYGLDVLYAAVSKVEDIQRAEIDLQKLVNELSKLEVKTSVELLQEAKVNQIDYKIKYEDDDKIPRLVEYKYIDVPLSNGYEETLLQEHKYGDKDYELSVNSPVKKMEFKLAKQGI